MVDAEVRLVWKHSLAVGAVLGLVSCPVAAETGQTITVSTWYGRRFSEDVSTQRAQEVLLIQKAYRRGHTLKTKGSFYFFYPLFEYYYGTHGEFQDVQQTKMCSYCM